MKFYISRSVGISFEWDTHLKILSDYAKRKNRDWSDVLDSVEMQIARLKYVDEICFNHQSWIKADFETGNLKIAEKRLDDLTNKLSRIFNRYTRK